MVTYEEIHSDIDSLPRGVKKVHPQGHREEIDKVTAPWAQVGLFGSVSFGAAAAAGVCFCSA